MGYGFCSSVICHVNLCCFLILMSRGNTVRNHYDCLRLFSSHAFLPKGKTDQLCYYTLQPFLGCVFSVMWQNDFDVAGFYFLCLMILRRKANLRFACTVARNRLHVSCVVQP